MKKILLFILLFILTGCTSNIGIDVNENILTLELFGEEPEWASEINVTKNGEVLEMKEEFIIEDVDTTTVGTYSLTVQVTDEDKVLEKNTFEVIVTETDFDQPEEVVLYFYGMLNEMYQDRAELVDFCNIVFTGDEVSVCENSMYDNASFEKISVSRVESIELSEEDKTEIGLNDIEKVYYVRYLQEVIKDGTPEYFTNFTYVIYVDGRYYLESF